MPRCLSVPRQAAVVSEWTAAHGDLLWLDLADPSWLAILAGTRRGPAPRARVSPLLQRVLDAMARLPAFATNHRLDWCPGTGWAPN